MKRYSFYLLAPIIVALSAHADDAITIDTDFPGGNINVTSMKGSEVRVEPDLRGDKPWFYWCFEATSKRAGSVEFIFPDKVAGFVDGAIGFQGPAISRDGGGSWSWMGTDQVDGSSFVYEFSKANERVRFAVTIPYLEKNLGAFLKKNALNPHLKTSVLTRSRKGREVELLQIGEPTAEKKSVLVTARHHASETIASYVFEGFLQEAISESAAGKKFRENYLLFAVPFVDKDGTEEGDQGKNRKPHDHNRDYGPDSIYPEIRAIKQLHEKQSFKFALDFHCPTLVMKDHQVMYFVGPKNMPKNNFENVSQFAGLIKKGLPAGAPVGPLVWLRNVIKPTPMNSHYFGFKEGVIMAATLEIPFAPPGKTTDPESLREYGKVILGAWVDTNFAGDFAPPKSEPKKRGKQEWLPLNGKHTSLSDLGGEQIIPEITITQTPKATADATKFENEYVIELEKFGISNAGSNPVETSRGLNKALQHAKSIGANRIVFPKGIYLISELEPAVLDHTDTIIDLNGATLQINTNGLQKYSIVEIVHGAENLRLTNGNIRGDKDKHDYTTEEGVHAWGHGLTVHGGRSLELDHLTISKVTGDGTNSRLTGARDRPELLAKIAHSIYAKELEQGAFSRDGQKIESTEKTRSKEPYDLKKCDGEFEFGYSTGYLGYPFVQGRVYQAWFYDDEMNFIEMKKCLQFRKVSVPDGGKFVHLEFNQPNVSDDPLHSGAGKGSFVGRISNYKGSVDVHFHHNKLMGNRRLGMGYCGGRRWLIEDNVFAGNGGVAPAYGIDLEDGWEFMQDVVIRNNRFKDNVAGDLVICAGSELLIEGNTFEKNVALHGRPHNYIFRNNKFTGGNVSYKTRTGVARIHDNQYENCTISIKYDTAAVADGLNRSLNKSVSTPSLILENETLTNVEKITGTYFDFDNVTLKNAHFIADEATRQIRFRNCIVQDSTISYEAAGPRVNVDLDGDEKTLEQMGPGLARRRSVDLGLPFFQFNQAQRAGKFHGQFAKWAREDVGMVVADDEILVLGSSSIKGWRSMAKDLSPAKIIHRGFGGSRMKDVLVYKDFFRRYQAERIVIYEGDNDLAGSYELKAETFLQHCEEFVVFVREVSPATRFYFISIKPSTARMKKWPLMKEGNKLLQQYAASDDKIELIDIASRMLNPDGSIREELIGTDGVHMTRAGYDIWAEMLRSQLGL